jgi:hypothetical protein
MRKLKAELMAAKAKHLADFGAEERGAEVEAVNAAGAFLSSGGVGGGGAHGEVVDDRELTDHGRAQQKVP